VVRNETGIEIPNGTAVYANGVTAGSGRITVAPYVADGSVREVRFLGIATENISTGVNGFVTYFGYIRGLDTRGTTASSIAVGDETWAVGDILYVHPTVAGKLTKVKPQHEVTVAIVITRHQSAGVIFVRPTSSGHLEDIHDISINTGSLTNGQVLMYNNTNGLWENNNNFTGSFIGDGSQLYNIPLSGVTNLTTISSSFDSRINTITGSIDEFTAFTSVINSFTSSVVLTSQTSSMSVLTSSYALTASFALNAGGGTEGRTARLDQTTPSTTWTFNHNLGEQYPTVTIYDGNDEVIIPQTISADSNNTLTITFPSAQSGHAVATVGGGLPYISSSFNGYVLTVDGNSPTWKGDLVSGSLQINELGFATTGSNTFVNNQTINGTLSITDALVKQTTTTGVTTNTVVSSLPTGSYDGGFFDYVIKNGTNMRAGTITSVWSSSNIEFNEVTTNDLGNTSGVDMSVTLSGGNTNLNANVSSGTWTIKVLSRGL
jgi:hypothetical protein